MVIHSRHALSRQQLYLVNPLLLPTSLLCLMQVEAQYVDSTSHGFNKIWCSSIIVNRDASLELICGSLASWIIPSHVSLKRPKNIVSLKGYLSSFSRSSCSSVRYFHPRASVLLAKTFEFGQRCWCCVHCPFREQNDSGIRWTSSESHGWRSSIGNHLLAI